MSRRLNVKYEYSFRHVIAVDAYKPLEGQYRWIKAKLGKLLKQVFIVYLHKLHKDLLVYQHSNHHGEVFEWQVTFDNHCKQPKCFL